jgi:hypothetical protein
MSSKKTANFLNDIINGVVRLLISTAIVRVICWWRPISSLHRCAGYPGCSTDFRAAA